VFLIVYNHPQAGPVYLAEFRRRRGGRARCKFSRRRDDARPFDSPGEAARQRYNLIDWLADDDADRACKLLRRLDIIPANQPAPIPE
jgi:hypothetical protein